MNTDKKKDKKPVNKPKKRVDIGVCQFCGGPIREYSNGWGCKNREDCGAFIYKTDKFFGIVIKKYLGKSVAVRLLEGKKVKYTNVDIHGVKIDMEIGLSYDRTGTYKYRYTMNYLNYDKKNDKNFPHELDSGYGFDVSGFDVMNS